MAGWDSDRKPEKRIFFMFAVRWRGRSLFCWSQNSPILAIPFLVMTLAGCRSPATVDPAAVYESIHNDFLHGHLPAAQRNAEKAVETFSAGEANWAMRFRLLDAEILTRQGRQPEAIALLNNPMVTYPTSGDPAIKRALLCGLAYAKLGQDGKSDAELRKAEQLSDASSSALNGEVLQTEAIIQIRRNHLPEGCGPFPKKFAGRPGSAGLIP